MHSANDNVFISPRCLECSNETNETNSLIISNLSNNFEKFVSHDSLLKQFWFCAMFRDFINLIRLLIIITVHLVPSDSKTSYSLFHIALISFGMSFITLT